MDIWPADIYPEDRTHIQGTNIYGPYVVVVSNELSMQIEYRLWR